MTAIRKVDTCHGSQLPPSLDGKPFLKFSEGSALAADRDQWIICRARSRHGKLCWQPRSFVGSNKSVLRQVVRELGIEVRPETNAAAHAFLRLPPHRFLTWRGQVRRTL